MVDGNMEIKTTRPSVNISPTLCDVIQVVQLISSKQLGADMTKDVVKHLTVWKTQLPQFDHVKTLAALQCDQNEEDQTDIYQNAAQAFKEAESFGRYKDKARDNGIRHGGVRISGYLENPEHKVQGNWIIKPFTQLVKM